MASDGVRYHGKVTIVTGGSRGIGRGIVELFVRHGSKVVFCDIREELGMEVEKSIKDGNHAGEVMFVKCDMTYEEEIKSLVATTVEKHGRIDCVINNAGALRDAVPEKSGGKHHQHRQYYRYTRHGELYRIHRY